MNLSLKDIFQILGVAGASASFLWGVFVWREAQKDSHLSAMVEAAKPFLSLQLALYKEAVGVTAKIATLAAGPEQDRNIQRFWELYWGELAFVESKEVESAMVNFGDALKKDAGNTRLLMQLSLKVADACRKSIGLSWNARDWVNPDATNRNESVPP